MTLNRYFIAFAWRKTWFMGRWPDQSGRKPPLLLLAFRFS